MAAGRVPPEIGLIVNFYTSLRQQELKKDAPPAEHYASAGRNSRREQRARSLGGPAANGGRAAARRLPPRRPRARGGHTHRGDQDGPGRGGRAFARGGRPAPGRKSAARIVA